MHVGCGLAQCIGKDHQLVRGAPGGGAVLQRKQATVPFPVQLAYQRRIVIGEHPMGVGMIVQQISELPVPLIVQGVHIQAAAFLHVRRIRIDERLRESDESFDHGPAILVSDLDGVGVFPEKFKFSS